MKRFLLSLAILVAGISIVLYKSSLLGDLLTGATLAGNAILTIIYPSSSSSSKTNTNTDTDTDTIKPAATIPDNNQEEYQYMLNAAKNTMSKTLHHAKITPHRSATRGHSDHGWLNTFHSFSFADWYNPKFNNFGSLRVLNEDRVKPNTGFPTHPHRDFEIFSYILSGELTHRDSMLKKGAEGGQSDRFYRMHRGDVQFTTGGTGISHSELNEHSSNWVHFLQIWAMPWKRGLTPRYHTRHFDEEEKRKGFVPILSPLKGGPDATAEQEKVAEPTIPDTIPIHADFTMSAGILEPGAKFEYLVGAKVTEATKRKVFVHVPMCKGGKAKVRLDGRDEILEEGDGAFVENVQAGDKLLVESLGDADAEVIVLDTA